MELFEEQKKKIQQVHERIYPIICEIDDFCKENKIQYFLSAGTCLGAVRHQGFIPWDYDADIMFPRKEYERFVKEYKASKTRKYEIGSLETDSSWNRQFGRIWDPNTVFKKKNLNDVQIGAFVDIFPIDGFPQNTCIREFYFIKMKIYSSLGYAANKTEYLKTEKMVPIKKLVHFVLKPIGWRYFSERMNKLALQYSFDNSVYAGVGVDPTSGKHEVMDRRYFENEDRLLFVDRTLAVPKDYHKYLQHLYGNYMTVPEGAEEENYRNVDTWEMVFSKE